MPPLNLLIKPSSGICNIRCKYCFYRDITEKREQASYGFMTEETLENVIRKALEFADKECTIAYQGGEPSLVGLDFYKKSIELQNKYNLKKITIHNAIQTNGYRMSEDWAKFLSENNFLVGLSLDGIKDTHDPYRNTFENKGTFNEVMKTVNLFNKYHIEYNILTVVNAKTSKRIDSIYSFYKRNGFKYLQFIPCLDPLGEEAGQNDYSLTPKAYGDFLKHLFDLWYRDIQKGEFISIRQFDNYVQMLAGYPPESCGMSGVCICQNVVEADGQVYPCDFYVIDQYKLDNLNYCSFEDINQKMKEKNFIESSFELNQECRTCKFLNICHGGCKRYREPKLDDKYQLNYFCESYYDFFEHSIEKIKELAVQLMRGTNN